MANLNTTDSAAVYESIDLNTTGPTTLYSPDTDAELTGVYLPNSGSTAEVSLEITDGTDTGTLTASGAGGTIEFGDTIRIGQSDSVQLNVTTAEGAALTETATLFKTD